MKNYLILTGLFLVFSCAFAQKISFVEYPYLYGYCPCNQNSFTNRVIYRPTYNPYSNYYQNPYYNMYNYARMNINTYQQVQKQKRMRRLERKRLNRLSFLRNNNNGTLTGYSVPVSKDDVYKQMGISPYDPKTKQKYNSINCSQELFSAPSGDEMLYSNGRAYKNLGGVSGKTGVTIIYD